MKTIYYALMLMVSCLAVFVFARAIDAGLDGNPIGWFLVGLMAVFAYVIYDDAISIMTEEDETQ
jgi:hypothetical protein